MQKKRIFALILLALMMAWQTAAAQMLPGIECFSPGLVRVAALEAGGAPVTAEADMTIDNAMVKRVITVSIYSAVFFPGLTPGMKPLLSFKCSAICTGLITIAV